MKQKLIIVAFLVFSLMAAFALKASAQTEFVTESANAPDWKTSASSGNPIIYETVLLADETAMTYSKTGAKITCSNDSVHFKLYQKWQHTFIHYGWRWKKDRHGSYKFYVISISKKDGDLIREWAKSNL